MPFSPNRIQMLRAFVILLLLSRPFHSFGNESSPDLSLDESFFQFVASIDQLTLQGKENDIPELIQKALPDGPLRNALLARTNIIQSQQKLTLAITMKRREGAIGFSSAKELLQSLKLAESLTADVKVLQDLSEKHPADLRINYAIASAAFRHGAVVTRQMMRIIDVGETGKSKELIQLFVRELVLEDMVVLGRTTLQQMQTIDRESPATTVCFGLLRSFMNPVEGAEMVLSAFQGSARFPFALQHLLENIDVSGLGNDENDFKRLLVLLVQEGEASKTMIQAAKTKYQEDLEMAEHGYGITGALGAPSPMFAENAKRARAMRDACDLLLANVNLIRSVSENPGPPTEAAGK